MPFNTLPFWVHIGAFLLAVNAGMINVLGLVTVLHQAISHMTGNVSILAMSLVNGEYDILLYASLVTLSYVLGSMYSGWILANSHFSLGCRYGIPLSLVAFFIVLCWAFLPYFPAYGLLWAAAAMGVQNAMVSHYQGAIIRTTHLSGVLTDLGLALGYFLRGLNVGKRRVILHLLILFGFICGGVIASLLYPLLQLNAFLIPASLSFCMSLVYWAIYWHYRHD